MFRVEGSKRPTQVIFTVGREAPPRLSSILFGGPMVPNIQQDYVLLLGIVLFTKNITLLGSTTKNATHVPGFLTNIRSFSAGFTRRR